MPSRVKFKSDTLPKKKRNRAAQEATLINVRAWKKRLEALEARVKNLEAILDSHGIYA